MMYATHVSSGPFLQSKSITRRLRTVVAVVVLLVWWRPCTDLRSAEAWRAAPEYLDLFAPRLNRDAYRAYVSALGFDETLRAVAGDPAALRPPGAWEPESVIPFDAFGRTGSYNRWKLAGLYGSRRARVARGPRIDDGHAESWMLVSPYPDPALQRLEPGTLILVLRIPPA
jgi:hypothetical protein